MPKPYKAKKRMSYCTLFFMVVGAVAGVALLALACLLAYMAYREEKDIDRDLQKADRLAGNGREACNSRKDSPATPEE